MSTRLFETRLGAAHPVLHHHRVFGKAVLPGLAYIDLLYQLAEQIVGIAPTQYALRKLCIHAPLALDDGAEAALEFRFEPSAQGWQIAVSASAALHGLLATAELCREDGASAGVLDLAALRAAATARIDLQTIYAAARTRGLVHSGLMQAQGEIFVLGGDRLVRLTAQQDADLPPLPFHPALIDGAAMATESLRADGDDELYLPLFYDAFRASAPLQHACYAHIRAASIRSVNDIHTLDIEFYADDGRQIGALNGITSKRVRAAEHITAAAAVPTAVTAAPAPAHAGSGAIEPVLRGIVAARLGVAPAAVDSAAAFFSLGLQSAQLLAVVADIERAFALSLSPTLLFEFGSLDEVAAHVSSLLATRAPTPVAVPAPSAAATHAVTAAGYAFRATDPLLADHRVYGRPALMGIVHPCLAVDSALRAGKTAFPLTLDSVVFHGGPIMPAAGESVGLRVDWSPVDGSDAFAVRRQSGGDTCCNGRLSANLGEVPAPIDVQALWDTATELPAQQLQRLYHDVRDFEIGPTLRTITRAARGADASLICRIDLAGRRLTAGDDKAYALNPLLLSSCYFVDASDLLQASAGAALVPLAIERLSLFGAVPEQVVVVTRVHTRRDGFAGFDAQVYTEQGICVAALRNASLASVRDAAQFAPAAAAAVSPPARAAAAPGVPAPVAVVGLSGRYPQAPDLDAFWDNLASGRDCIGEIPAERWAWQDYYSADTRAPGRIASKWGGFIDGVDQFAPLFFAISPREAAYMDPQERLFLEECWNALEDAGYSRSALAGTQVGVYCGVMSQEYPLYAVEADVGAGRIGLPSGIASIANRVSYCLDLRGPSMAVDTMCSSSLTAIALACDALRSGRIDAALAGGVNVSVHPNKYLMLGQGGFLSAQGQCGSFGSGAGGYVPGEGVGVAVLKRLDDAQRDGDDILGLIHGIAVNHGGRTSGYAVPNPQAQFDVVRRAWQQSDLDPRRINYIEAHGTGTVLGDPIEIDGLSRAFREHTDARQFCAIGSVKSNIGHCESAAGIAALSKVLLQLRHGQLAPSLHCAVLNPNIDFPRSPFVVQREAAAWPRLTADRGMREYARVAGISSFGAGGSNAHLLVEEFVAPMPMPMPAPRPAQPVLVVLSARSGEELDARVARLQQALQRQAFAEDDLARIAYTLQVGREAMEERLAFVAASLAELSAGLAAAAAAGSGVFRARIGTNVAFSLFSKDEESAGMVAAWAAKGRLDRIAELWVHGGTLDWRLLQPLPVPQRIRLPGYPFARQRCWIGDSLPAAAPAPRAVVSAAPAAAPVAFGERWIEAEAVPSGERAAAAPAVAVFASRPLHQRQIADAVQREWPGARIVFIADAQCAETGADALRVQRDDAASWAAACSRLREQLAQIDVALHCWALEDAPSAADAAGLLLALQALAAAGIAPGRLLVAGQSRAHSLQQCALDAQDALLRSASRVLPGSRLACAFGWLDEDETEPDLQHWLPRLFAECGAEHLESVRYRGGRRLRREYRPLALPMPAGAALPFKSGGTYLISGGLGALGLVVARHLARELQPRLILLGRSPLDAARREQIADLERLGAQASYVTCDVADAAALQTALAPVRQRLGHVHGVIHAAGVAGRSGFAQKSAEEFAAVLAPKVAGTLALDQVLADEPLDFFCCFGSVAAVLGDFGGGDYAAASRFQMAYAACRERLGLPGRSITINWPLWQDSGLEFGSEASQALYLRSSGQEALSSADALRLLPMLLGQDETSPVLLVGAAERLQAMLDARAAPLRLRPAPLSAPLVERTGLPLARRIEQDLKQVVGELLQIAVGQLHRDSNLADFGFDSVTLQEFALRLSERYRIELAAAVFFDYPSLARLAAFLGETQAQAMTALLDPAAAPVADPVAAPPVAAAAAAPAPAATVHGAREAIAVIGMSGRFPNARSVEEMWQLLAAGADAISEIPPDRFDWRAFYTPGADATPGRTNCKWSGILPGADEFDPLFFEISPREAVQIDPRQRLLLQEAYRALEDAGYGPRQLAGGSVGVFVGAEPGTYQGLGAEKETITASHDAVLAARLSYFLDLSGPNMAINTACSSGLVALHQACLQLRAGECDTAIAAGVNLLLAPEPFIGMSQTGMLSPDGRCFTFDRRANGMVPGEAIVALVLKRLTDAERDGDPIHALVRASGINHDGRTNGLTAPSGRAQRQLLDQVYDSYGIDVGAIDYVLAHGTATRLGDQIEVRALCDTYAARGAQRQQVALASTKSTFGHTFAASGLLSVVAVIQAMRHALIPRSLHCAQESDDVRWDESPFFVAKTERPWPGRAGRPRLAAVSAFGMSGTNAHAVLQSYARSTPLRQRARHLLALSARSAAALQQRAAELAQWLRAQPAATLDLAGISHTLLAGRHHHRHRLMLLVGSAGQALDQLDRFVAGTPGDFCSGSVAREFEEDAARAQRLHDDLRRCAAATDADRLHADLYALALAYCAGYEPDWALLWPDSPPHRLHLPAYPFERKRYWREAPAVAAAAVAAVAPPAAPAGRLGDAVVVLVLEHLGLERADIGEHDPLDEFGLDSVGAARLLLQIRDLLPEVVGSLFLEYNSLAGLRQYFAAFEATAPAIDPGAASAAPAAVPAVVSGAAGVSLIGLAGLFPQARNAAEFWQRLSQQTVVTGVLPEQRRALLGLKPVASSALCHGGFIDAVECFDYERFKMSREEARSLDPQLRKLFEVVAQAIADGGWTPAEFKKIPTGVFVATAGHSGYREIPDYREPGAGLPPAETAALYANRISNLFDLKGPSTVVDAGCASFLVALEQALAAIHSGRCEQAVVAAAQLYLSPHALAADDHGPLYSKGSCTRSFARDSDGYVRSETVGAVILKRDDLARRDGDDVYCRLLAAGVCHGGKSPLKWYSPNVKGQRAAIREALDRAGIGGDAISYVEVEANGSQLGDASEIVALQAEYAAAPRGAEQTTYIGSLKPLCGHAEAAAAFPALVKVVLSLRHGQMLGVVDPGEYNEGIQLKPGFQILTGARPWPASAQPRRAAVHSLSVGGVNAHVLLEDAAAPPAAAAAGAQLFVFSARTPELLRVTLAEQVGFIAAAGAAAPAAAGVSHTLQVGREAEPCRLAVVATTLAELQRLLQDWLDGGVSESSLLVAASGALPPLLDAARTWVAGGRVDWNALRGSAPSPRRVHLPPKPLLQEPVWHHEVEHAGERPAEAGAGAVLLVPRWVAQTESTAIASAAPRRVVFCGWTRERAEAFRQQAADEDLRALPLPAASIAEQFRSAARALFAEVKDILAQLRGDSLLLQIVVPAGLQTVGLHGLVGLLRTAMREHSRFRGQLIVLDRDCAAAAAVAGLRRVAVLAADYVQLRDGTPWVQSWETLATERLGADQERSAAQREADPVVLITGGAGGIGLDLAEQILRSSSGASVFLAGRSMNPPHSERIARLQVRGRRLHYMQADVGSLSDVESLIAEILRRCGRLTGIYHCAGVVRDSYVVRKDLEEIDEVLSPKVAGLHNLDQATKDIPLDFVMAFSSLSAMYGNPGQADYCMANAFMDAFAAYRNQLVCLGERSGRTLSVNWPLWSQGGMGMSEEIRQGLERGPGLMPMPNSVGIDIALKLLGGPATQIAVKYGRVARLLEANVLLGKWNERSGRAVAGFSGGAVGGHPEH